MDDLVEINIRRSVRWSLLITNQEHQQLYYPASGLSTNMAQRDDSFSVSLWERVGERITASSPVISYAPLPQPFSQREKEEETNDRMKNER